MSSERHPRGAPCQPQPSYPLGPLPTPQPALAPPKPAPPPAQQRMNWRWGSCHGSPTSNAVSGATLSGHTYLYTPQYPHAAPREPGRDSGAHSTGGPSVCVGGEEGWLCQSGLAARALSQHPGLDNLYLHSWVAGKGKGLPGPCILAFHLFRFPTLLLGRVWRPAGKAGATPPPEQTPEETVGWGWCGSTGDTTHPTTVAQARRGTAGAEAGGRPLWTGKSHRQGGRRGREAGRLGGWWGGLGPGSNAGGSLLGAGTRPFHGSTGRLYQAACPPLPCGRTPAWAPSSQRERCSGHEGNSVAETRADRGQPRTGDHGAQVPGAPAQRASSDPCDQSLPREAGGPGAGNLGLEASMSKPSSPPSRQACQHPACPALPCPTAPSSGGLRPLNAALPPSSSHPLRLLHPALPLRSLPAGRQQCLRSN